METEEVIYIVGYGPDASQSEMDMISEDQELHKIHVV